MNSDRIYYSREAEMRARRDVAMIALLLTTLGIGVGAAIALLLAPHSGDETRNVVGRSLKGVLETGRDAVEHIADGAQDVIRKVGN